MSSGLRKPPELPSAAGSLDQAPRIASSSGNESITSERQSASGTSLRAASTSIRPDLSSSNQSQYEGRRASDSPLRTVRPSQRHSIDSSVKYSLGASRINGGRLDPSDFP